MRNLETKITNAKTSKELEYIVNSIKRQDNGFKNALAKHLEDAFWYIDLADDVSKQKTFMIRVSSTYSYSFKQFQ
jgi:hypothetical protein